MTNPEGFQRATSKRKGGSRPTVTFHATCWRTVADFDQPHGRKNAHGEAMVTPGFDYLGELNDWLSDDTEWLYEEITRYRRTVFPGRGEPKDEPITESGDLIENERPASREFALAAIDEARAELASKGARSKSRKALGAFLDHLERQAMTLPSEEERDA
jgi:hypothetical protein